MKQPKEEKSTLLAFDKEEEQEINRYRFYSPGTGVAVVAKYRDDINCTAIGVSKCGPDDEPDEKLGLEIAEHRVEVKPFACVPHSFTIHEFRKIAHVIASHLISNDTWNQKGLKRIDNDKNNK